MFYKNNNQSIIEAKYQERQDKLILFNSTALDTIPAKRNTINLNLT